MTNVSSPEDPVFDATILVRRMGHDFNNLFSIVLGGLTLLREEIPESAWDADCDEIYNDVMSATREAAGVIAQLTAWAARQSLEPEETDLGDIIEQAKLLLRRALPDAVDIRTHCIAPPLTVCVDRARLIDCILELSANANAAMPDGGTLTIEATRAGDVSLVVSDTGLGMSPAVVEQCKQPYFTTMRSKTHRGLGLSVVDGFTRASGARLSVASTPMGGTQVTFHFPTPAALAESD